MAGIMIGKPVGVVAVSSGSLDKSLDGSRTCCTGREGSKSAVIISDMYLHMYVCMYIMCFTCCIASYRGSRYSHYEPGYEDSTYRGISFVFLRLNGICEN